ncbi:UTRA domain-containing protein [Burkholderia ubonensis]|uniref:UTRA domain-containing protein n=1 Tax=Burkholderia ubonensis TaxID=101571 RepID=A0AB74D5L5_9BURK|nr:UTRA domain-containing protein [Burkholderia ubonensis]PAJ81990.1 hypothetical protein CJO71_04925 [Burkholderia ubonensis]PAJ89049.1 hypothetical protein CJO70_04055 [Burkholderia ubonensis]PAJ95661.1 hypothetical protein CJO69_04825 [Burkholderia ubonensis]PAK01968.1 hypothetical protein CJO68_06620 [Burkholderia ubonensis]PAK03303.1 hypothetical protein CJO67_35520 [Burkholderia ubonensis]
MKPSNQNARGRPRARAADRAELFDAEQVAALRAPGNGSGSSAVDFGDSLYRALQDADVHPVRPVQRLRAELASARDAELLCIRAGDPVMSIERRSFSSDGCPLELTCTLYRGDRYDYVAVLDQG